jgi:hypothetical protein
MRLYFLTDKMNEMNIERAIEILELHNKWRRDNDGKYEMAKPKELGVAIDTVVSEFKNLHLQCVSQRSELLSDLEKWLDKKGNEIYCSLPAQYVLDKYKSLNCG